MLDYTKTALKQIEEEFKRFFFIFSIISQLLYAFYLGYAIATGLGILAVNAILLGLSVLYLGFFIFASQQEVSKTVKSTVKLVYKRCKQVLKLFTLGVLVYGLYLTGKNASPLSIILTVFMIIAFILDILFEIILRYFVSRSKLLLEGMKADIDEVTKPVRTVGNFFKKMTGKEVEEPTPTKQREYLDKKVAQTREERKQQKQAQKQAKKQEKLLKKQEKRRAKEV